MRSTNMETQKEIQIRSVRRGNSYEDKYPCYSLVIFLSIIEFLDTSLLWDTL
jgi:hypothetical protein